jgi:hypothetical protein
MRRWVAVLWHASFSFIAAGLYFAFVLPRWWELMGTTPHTLGTVLRIVAGALIGLAALPVVFTLLKSRRPEFGTPRLALNLRVWSIVLHVLAGLLIVGAAISEIWLSLDAAGPWLFGVYGGAAAVALLAIFTFDLAYVAEMPPPPPKPLKPKKETQRRGRRKKAGEESELTDEAEVTDTDETEAPDESDEPAEVTAEAGEPETTADEPGSTAQEDAPSDEADSSSNGKLRNRRPTGKDEPTRRRRRRLRGGVAVDD